MSGTSSETLTAALRRLADEHASGLLSIATAGRDVVLELADGAPVGIGPTHEVGDRVGRHAAPELVAAAVVDDLVDRAVAAIVGGGGEWTWDIESDASLMPVPPGLAAELSRRAVDAAQALAELDAEIVLVPARQFDVTGELGRMQELFDGERSLTEVADLVGVTVAAAATHAAALVRAGVLSNGVGDPSPSSWSDTVAGTAVDDDDDEPEPWVMDPPDDPPPAGNEPTAQDGPAAAKVDDSDPPVPAATSDGLAHFEPPPGAAAADTEAAAADTEAAAAELETAQAAAEAEEVEAEEVEAADDENWADSTWLDDLDGGPRAPTDDEPTDDEPTGGSASGDSRAELSAMLTELQGPEGAQRPTPSPEPKPKPVPDIDDSDDPPEGQASEARRREPRAEPGEVAEFLRELSRLALDED